MWLATTIAIALAAGATGAPPPEKDPPPPPKEDVATSHRASIHEQASIRIAADEASWQQGGASSTPAESYSAATGNSVGTGPESDPPCPVGRWVHGEFYIDTAACDGEFGGTEWVLLLAEDEETDVEAGVAPAQRIAVTRRDVESLLVHSGSLEVQPDRGWVLVNIETIVMTDAVEHVLATEVLGMDVEVRVTPVSFAWDFGDGSPPLVGTDPGAPWPHHTVWHVYQDAGQVTIGLRTEWDAAFRVEGMTGWLPVEGRAVTEASSEPIDVITATPRLTTGQ